MRILGLIALYAVVLFLMGPLLLDVESMLVSELTANKELDIPENVLLDALEDMRYWNRFSVLFTFLILVVKCFLMTLVLYGGLFFANLHQGIRLGTLFRVTAFAEVALVLAGVVKIWVGAVSGFTYSEFAIFYPLSLLSVLGTDAIDPLFYSIGDFSPARTLLFRCPKYQSGAWILCRFPSFLDGVDFVSHAQFYLMMKKIILSLLILVLFASGAWLIFSFQKKNESVTQAEERAESIPTISLTTISGKKFSLLQLSSGIPTVLIYFNSTCEICQMELKSIADRISDFDDAHILLISSQEHTELEEFYSTHPLRNLPNVYWLMDEQMEVSAHYGVRSVPALLCYDAMGKLQGKFQGRIKVDVLLKNLSIVKELTQ